MVPLAVPDGSLRQSAASPVDRCAINCPACSATGSAGQYWVHPKVCDFWMEMVPLAVLDGSLRKSAASPVDRCAINCPACSATGSAGQYWVHPKVCDFWMEMVPLAVPDGSLRKSAASPVDRCAINCPACSATGSAGQFIPTRLRVLSHSYFSPYFWLICVRFLSFCFVFLCILCVLSPFGTVLVSKFGINFLKKSAQKKFVILFQ